MHLTTNAQNTKIKKKFEIEFWDIYFVVSKFVNYTVRRYLESTNHTWHKFRLVFRVTQWTRTSFVQNIIYLDQKCNMYPWGQDRYGQLHVHGSHCTAQQHNPLTSIQRSIIYLSVKLLPRGLYTLINPASNNLSQPTDYNILSLKMISWNRTYTVQITKNPPLVYRRRKWPLFGHLNLLVILFQLLVPLVTSLYLKSFFFCLYQLRLLIINLRSCCV